MDSIFHGRSLVPLFEISRPPLKPPCSICLSEIDSNQACQASMIYGVGFLNPKCRNMNFFISPSLLIGVLKDLPVASVLLMRRLSHTRRVMVSCPWFSRSGAEAVGRRLQAFVKFAVPACAADAPATICLLYYFS